MLCSDCEGINATAGDNGNRFHFDIISRRTLEKYDRDMSGSCKSAQPDYSMVEKTNVEVRGLVKTPRGLKIFSLMCWQSSG